MPFYELNNHQSIKYSKKHRHETNNTKTNKNWLAPIKALTEENSMPAEMTDVESFVAMSAKANHCQVKRNKENVKLKLRTPGQLYTLKIEKLQADEIIKKLKCEIKETEE
jgi:ferritin-like protein